MEDFSGENSARNVSRIKRRMLTQDEELNVETKLGYAQKVKNNVVSGAEGELYKELRAAKDESEKQINDDFESEDKKRAEYEMWRKNNEQEYIKADKIMLICDIAGKAAVIFAIIMIAVYLVEILIQDKKLTVMLVTGIFCIVARIALDFVRKAAEKKKGFYARVIEGDSINIRSNNSNFKEI